MISVRGRRRFRRERPSVAPSLALSVTPLVSSPPPKSEIPKQPKGPLGPKFPADTSTPKYSEEDLQRILKAVLEARVPVCAPTPALVPVLVISEVPQEKLKARSQDVYRGKSYIDCYNFCQQYEEYFATDRATGPTQILFAASFFQDRISFRWQ